MSKRVKNVVLTLAAISSFAALSFGVSYAYWKMNAQVNQYKVQNQINLDYDEMHSENQKILTITKSEKIYLTNNDESLLLGELSDGDVVSMLSRTTSGWSQIMYHGVPAYVKTIGIMKEVESSFKAVEEQVYILPEALDIISVNKSDETTTKVSIQMLVDRTAINDS